MPINSQFPYLSLGWSHKRISLPSGVCTCGFQSCHLLTAALSFRVWGALLSISSYQSRNCMPRIMSQRLEAREHMSQCGTLPGGVGSHPLWGLSPWRTWHLLVPQVLPSIQGAGPDAQNIQLPNAQRETQHLHQAPKQERLFHTKSLHHKHEGERARSFLPFTLKGPPKIPCA